ncbi:MAG: efflux RND transporter periplasmic adaptor subunit, partial [Planctomycetes bacterium]|nr:efflux RND transporter periplasmic adaptor subunit [Planctomycetota bacterium]
MKRFIISAVIAAVAFCGAAVGGVVAARHGWQPPPWLSFLGGGEGQAVDAGLYCREHGVPEKFCTLCHEELKSRLLMCNEHGLPEEICTLCHPEAEKKYGLKPICKQHRLPEHFCPKCSATLLGGEVESDWCPEHGVPESLCTRCRPELAQSVAMCAEHGVPAALCTICRPELARNFTMCKAHGLPAAICPRLTCQAAATAAAQANKVCPEHGPDCKDGKCKLRPESAEPKKSLPLVRLAGPDVAKKAGITVEPAELGTVALILTASGEVGYDETRLAHVRSRVAGLLREVRVKPGDAVREGQVLAVIDSAELGQ